MADHPRPFFLPGAKSYLADVSDAEQGAIFRDIDSLVHGDFGAVRTKKLRGPILELIVGHSRITYFQIDSILYFVRGFRKKSQKTPRQEIEYAETMYRKFKKAINKTRL